MNKILLALSLFVLSFSCRAQASKDTLLTFKIRKPIDSVEIYTVADQMPVFPGGEDALFRFLSATMKYPEDAKNREAQGTVFIGFHIDQTGKANNIRVIRSSKNKILDQEALRVISLMPLWIPGKDKGVEVPVQINIPVVFKIK